MDVGSYSVLNKQAQVNYQVNVSLMKKVMDTAEQRTDLMNRMLEVNTKMLQQMMQPHLGANIDFRI